MILTHDQFGKIPQSLDIQKEIIEDEIRDVEEALDVLKNSGMGYSGRQLEKGLEKRIENMKVKLNTIMNDIKLRKTIRLIFAAWVSTISLWMSHISLRTLCFQHVITV